MPSTPVRKEVGFPVYALEWRDNSTLIASGGGGPGNFGVTNKIVRSIQSALIQIIAKVIQKENEEKPKIQVVEEYQLSSDAGCVVEGIYSSQVMIDAGGYCDRNKSVQSRNNREEAE
jgi:hypothetical protein